MAIFLSWPKISGVVSYLPYLVGCFVALEVFLGLFVTRRRTYPQSGHISNCRENSEVEATPTRGEERRRTIKEQNKTVGKGSEDYPTPFRSMYH